MVSGLLDAPGLLEHEELLLNFGVIPGYLSLALYLSPMTFAAGLLAGRGGLSFFLGGLAGWWVLAPATAFLGWLPLETGDSAVADILYSDMMRPLGIGVLIGSALMAVVMSFPSIRAAFGSMTALERKSQGASIPQRGDDQMPA